MTAGFAGPLKGTRVTAHVFTVRFLKRDVAVLHTRGGILFPGETEVPPERLGIQVWVVTKQAGTSPGGRQSRPGVIWVVCDTPMVGG